MKGNNIVIGICVIIIIIIVIFLLAKKEHYSNTGIVASSGSGNPIPNISYLVADQNGNVVTTNNGQVNNLDVEGNMTLKGYSGNPGDVLVSNGESAPPIWTGQIPKILVIAPLSIPSVDLYNVTLANLPIPIDVTPDMTIIVDVMCTLSTHGDSGLWTVYFTGFMGDQKYVVGGLFNQYVSGYTNNLRFIFSSLSGTVNFGLQATVPGGGACYAVSQCPHFITVSVVTLPSWTHINASIN